MATEARPRAAAIVLIALIAAAGSAACAAGRPDGHAPRPAPAAPTSTAPAQAAIVFGGYGSIIVSASEDDVKVADPSASPPQALGACAESTMPGAARNGQAPAYVFGSDHRLIGVRPPAAARTASGVGVGDTAGRVRAAYPGTNLEWVYGYQGTAWVALVSSPADKNATIGFVFDGSDPDNHPANQAQVIDIAAGARDFASGFEICQT